MIPVARHQGKTQKCNKHQGTTCETKLASEAKCETIITNKKIPRLWSAQVSGRLTGNGSAPSWMTKPSIRCVRMWDLTIAWAALASSVVCCLLLLLLLLPVPFPEVMTGATAATLHSQLATQEQIQSLGPSCYPSTIPSFTSFPFCQAAAAQTLKARHAAV